MTNQLRLNSSAGPSALFINSPWALIHRDEEANAAMLEWKNLVTGETYKQVLRQVLFLVRKENLSRCIWNLNSIENINKEDLKWSFQFWLPAMAQCGVKSFAVIVNEQHLLHLAIASYLEKQDIVEYGIFEKSISAMYWLQSH